MALIEIWTARLQNSLSVQLFSATKYYFDRLRYTVFIGSAWSIVWVKEFNQNWISIVAIETQEMSYVFISSEGSLIFLQLKILLSFPWNLYNRLAKNIYLHKENTKNKIHMTIWIFSEEFQHFIHQLKINRIE